jgi:EAL domain-containing protein (putative c-di-GMP-specific phosphodiesterase class I)
MLAWLQARKIRLILDSFGVGPCSVSTFRHTPIDMIRVHPSLIQERENGGPFIQAIVALGHALGIDIIADGVQTDSQLSIARRHGIDYAQGDLISPLVDGIEVTSLLSHKRLSVWKSRQYP